MLLKESIEQRHRRFDFSQEQFRSRNFNLENYRFDKYTIVKKIGSGSFATVYLAQCQSNHQKVAVKVINLKNIKDIKIQKLKQIKFRLAHSQSRIMMHFSSENIIKCYETFQSEDFKFMILEYCDGGDLAQKIQKQGKLQQDQAISMMKQIVNGLSQCHSKGIIHRDLKPQNIMLHNGVCKLADFGFSKILSINTQNENQTCINTTLGTPTTMAPEVKNFLPYGLKADIWSIGVIFFHMIFGKCPFESRQNFDKIMLRISGVLQKQQFYQGVKITDKVRKFFKQILVKDPKERLGWRGLIGHELFMQENEQQLESKQDNSQIQFSGISLRNSCFIRKASLNIDEQKMVKLQNQIIIVSENQKQQEKRKQNAENESEKQIEDMLKSLNFCDELINEDLKSQIQEQNYGKNKLDTFQKQISSIQSCQSQITSEHLSIESQYQTLLYNWSRHAYLQCQKTQLIYNKIILPIQTNKLLDLDVRKSIQFMYLLSTRCYNNMSPVYYVYQKHKNSPVLKQLTQMIEKLYRTIEKKWHRYGFLLTKKQNEKLQIASDWTKRTILSKLFPETYDYQRRQKFMAGIQNTNSYYKLSLQVYKDYEDNLKKQRTQQNSNKKINLNQENKNTIKDYTRQQQIQFTLEYFNQVKDKFMKRQSSQCREVLCYLSKLKAICNLSMEDLNNKPFRIYINQILLKQIVKK